jgi:hypothetical protein
MRFDGPFELEREDGPIISNLDLDLDISTEPVIIGGYECPISEARACAMLEHAFDYIGENPDFFRSNMETGQAMLDIARAHQFLECRECGGKGAK